MRGDILQTVTSYVKWRAAVEWENRISKQLWENSDQSKHSGMGNSDSFNNFFLLNYEEKVEMEEKKEK